MRIGTEPLNSAAMSWKVLITARTMNEVGASALQLLRDAGCNLIIPPVPGPVPADELMKRLPGMDAALASMDKFNASVLESQAAAELKIISRWGVGYDAIDVPAATRLGIVVAYAPGLLDEAVVIPFKPVVYLSVPGVGRVEMTMGGAFLSHRSARLILWRDKTDYLCVEPVLALPAEFDTPACPRLEPGQDLLLTCTFRLL